ncbi:hypothetical protein VP01_930g2 [Puccinia sorghi]|uniref:Uncharacterized protein n=1 Tax=Puccinia sorghi TaxID=27349 RepID=A0A0L6U705_9BASI|nr:hypothetical protein VP01_930g2 [Puccinia sorghi]
MLVLSFLQNTSKLGWWQIFFSSLVFILPLGNRHDLALSRTSSCTSPPRIRWRYSVTVPERPYDRMKLTLPRCFHNHHYHCLQWLGPKWLKLMTKHFDENFMFQGVKVVFRAPNVSLPTLKFTDQPGSYWDLEAHFQPTCKKEFDFFFKKHLSRQNIVLKSIQSGVQGPNSPIGPKQLNLMTKNFHQNFILFNLVLSFNRSCEGSSPTASFCSVLPNGEVHQLLISSSKSWASCSQCSSAHHIKPSWDFPSCSFKLAILTPNLLFIINYPVVKPAEADWIEDVCRHSDLKHLCSHGLYSLSACTIKICAFNVCANFISQSFSGVLSKTEFPDGSTFYFYSFDLEHWLPTMRTRPPRDCLEQADDVTEVALDQNHSAVC